MTKQIFEALHRASSFLTENGREEAVARFLLQHVLKMSHAQLLSSMRDDISEEVFERYWTMIEQHVKGTPFQYITNEEDFYGRTFYVDESVLIPRPETEELIEQTLLRAEAIWGTKKDLRVADIGTGSGAIAITIKKEWPEANVTATDISERALQTASKNATIHEANVRFLHGDLTEPLQHEKWDIVLSNPPYISEKEAAELSDIVIEHEPHNALFAADDGLALYKRLADELPPLMNKPMMIGLEIGYLQGEAVQQLFEKAFPQAKVEIVKDINRKNRMIFCSMSE